LYSLILFLYLFFIYSIFVDCNLIQFRSRSFSIKKYNFLKEILLFYSIASFSDCTFRFNKNQIKIHRLNKKHFKNQCVGRENRGMDEKQRAKGLSELKIAKQRERG